MRYLFDEFRIRIMVERNKFKSKVVAILKRILGKLDVVELKKCDLSKDVTFTISRFVPDDGKFHHVHMTIDYWIKLGPDGLKEEKLNLVPYVDGQQKE